MLIEVCGPDGSGKSTLVDILRGRLRADGHPAVYERSLRSESRYLLELARLSRGIVFHQRDIELAVLLDVVRQATGDLAAYQGSDHLHVFVQQWTHALAARLAVSGFGDDAGLQWLLCRMPVPDLSLRLRLGPAECLARMRQRAKGDDVLLSHRPEGAMRRIAEGFEATAQRLPYPQVVLDATRSPEKLADDAWPLLGGLHRTSREQRQRHRPEWMRNADG